MSEFDINQLVKEAQIRWLKPVEVLFILQNHENIQLNEAVPQKPPSGSLFLYNKIIVRFFRKDGHIWRRKRNGRTVGEGHERLKVGTAEALNCYYAHGEQNPNFQRRSYWMLDPLYEHIVLVHYREVHEGRVSSGSTLVSAGYSSVLSNDFYTLQNQGSISAVSKPYLNQSPLSQESVEVSSELFSRSGGRNLLDETGKTGEFSSTPMVEVQALQRLERQLSLNKVDIAGEFPFNKENDMSKDSGILDSGRSNQDELFALTSVPEHADSSKCSNEILPSNESNCCLFPPNSGDTENKESLIWNEPPKQYMNSYLLSPQCRAPTRSDLYEMPILSSEGDMFVNNTEPFQWPDGFENNILGNNEDSHLIMEYASGLQILEATQFPPSSNGIMSETSTPLLREGENVTISAQSAGAKTHEAISNYYANQVNLPEISIGPDLKVTAPPKQRFAIQEISPQWGYSTDVTKVIVIGKFLCDPSECAWSCMFGDVEVLTQIIQEGVLCCEAPPCIPGKVPLCITSSNHESCSELREFEYRAKPSICENCSSLQNDASRSMEEMLLLVQLTQMLLCDPLTDQSITNGLRIPKLDGDPWEHIIDALLVGSKTPFCTMDLLLQELLKNKLQHWLSSKYKAGETSCCYLSKKEQGIIHMVAGLGFEWALKPIINSGVSVNYRDVNGWTALHWAARYAREKMVAALVAAGASALAVTDPTPQDPVGKTPGSIADANGHKGLAGYLSEVALTSYLSSLLLEETDVSTVVEVERKMESISDGNQVFTEDQLSLKDSLAAARNATLAARRIQSAFRAHSFRRRKHREAASAYREENGISSDDIHGLSAASKLAFPCFNDHRIDKAALSIQKKYRGWKGRQEYLALRQKIMMIQAYVRGYQVRKRYTVMVWAVGVLDKVVLRWYHKRIGLQGFQSQSDFADESDYEDILKVFRKQKVDAAIEEALSQVLSMVRSPEARQQYRRMLENYWQAKADFLGKTVAETLLSQGNGQNYNMGESSHQVGLTVNQRVLGFCRNLVANRK